MLAVVPRLLEAPVETLVFVLLAVLLTGFAVAVGVVALAAAIPFLNAVLRRDRPCQAGSSRT